MIYIVSLTCGLRIELNKNFVALTGSIEMAKHDHSHIPNIKHRLCYIANESS